MKVTEKDLERLFGTSDLETLARIARQVEAGKKNPRGAGRKRVGRRRWARQRTPARSRATECRYTGTFRLRVPGTAASRRRDFAFPSPFALPDEGARGESFPPAGSGAEPRCLSGVRGGPRVPFLSSCLSCVFLMPVQDIFPKDRAEAFPFSESGLCCGKRSLP